MLLLLLLLLRTRRQRHVTLTPPVLLHVARHFTQ
jgi:hypothetical protein